MLSEIRMGSAIAMRRFRIGRGQVLSGSMAGMFLACWTLVGLTWIVTRRPEILPAASGAPEMLRSSLYAFLLGNLLLPLQLGLGQPSRGDGVRAWAVLVMIMAVGLFAGRGASAYGLAVGGLLLTGALPASLWMSDRRLRAAPGA